MTNEIENKDTFEATANNLCVLENDQPSSPVMIEKNNEDVSTDDLIDEHKFLDVTAFLDLDNDSPLPSLDGNALMALLVAFAYCLIFYRQRCYPVNDRRK